MPRRDTILPLSVFRPSIKPKPLPEACIKRLKSVVKLIHRIDLAAAEELHICKQLEADAKNNENSGPSRWMLSFKERRQFNAFYQKIKDSESSTVANASRTERDIREYLSDTQCISDWQLASKVVSRIQTRYEKTDSTISVSNECRIRAQTFLDLGSQVIRYLETVKFDLQELADEVLFGIRLKLDVIKAFDLVYKRQPISQSSNSQDSMYVHEFVDILDNFKIDEPLPTVKVAEAYSMGEDGSTPAILNAATLFAIVISMVPTIFAWQRAPNEIGSTNDSDFWQALQTLFMQLLSLFTMMLPVSRFAPEVVWQLAWTFAIIAGLCAVSTPILYVTVAVKWSFLVSFVASVAQAGVLLEIILRSRYDSDKKTYDLMDFESRALGRTRGLTME